MSRMRLVVSFDGHTGKEWLPVVYPLRPLLDAAGLTPTRFARRYRKGGSLVKRWMEEGLTWVEADRLALQLGYLPWQIWSDWNADIEVSA